MFRILSYIDVINKERNFSRAAQKLHLSQPSLSLTIKKFEQEIGIQIFDRSTTPIQLTEAGAVYLEGIQKILTIENDLEAYIDDYKELKTGKLTIGAAHLFASYLLPSLIARFLHKYPYIEIRLIEGDFHSLYDMVLNGKIDLFLDSNSFDENLFEFLPLFCEHVLLAVPSSDAINNKLKKYRLQIEDIRDDRHLGSDCPTVALSIFQNHRFLMLEKGHDMRARAKRLCRDSGFDPKTGMELNQLMTIYNMIDQQLGASFVSDTIVKLSNKGKRIFFYKLSGEHAVRHIHLAYKRNRYISRSMQALIDLMKELSPNGISSISPY